MRRCRIFDREIGVINRVTGGSLTAPTVTVTVALSVSPPLSVIV